MLMVEVDPELLQSLREQIRAGFDLLRDVRVEDRQRADQRHAENVDRLARIEHEVRVTNGRVTKNEEHIQQLFVMQRGERGDHGERGERGPQGDAGRVEEVTLDRLKWYLVIAGGSITGTVALLKLLGKL